MIKNYSDPYLSSQLIAYIGNKRKLLPFLGEIFSKLERENGQTTFIDPFSGSGSVARLGRFLGFDVYTNDIEYYSYCINLCHIKGTLSLFNEGLKEPLYKIIDILNSLKLKENGYFSTYYAPNEYSDESEYKGQRLFYTPRNARFIDTVREEIDFRYPENKYPIDIRSALIAPLLYQAATHANTSGVFKAYHYGYGGHNSDALKRILKDMKLEYPTFCDVNVKGKGYAFNLDAESFCKLCSADICYLDPPYNQHQYGSNYHILNTIARWDNPPITNDRDSNGNLLRKAGIRKDWIMTRSDFCSKPKAPKAMEDLLSSIDARHIVLSYNTEGIIPFENLIEIASAHGNVSMEIQEYTKYRGGRQSLHRKTHNLEFQIIINRTENKNISNQSYEEFLYEYKLQNLFQQTFSPERIQDSFDTNFFTDENEIMQLSIDGSNFELHYGIWFISRPDRKFLKKLSLLQKKNLFEKLFNSQTQDRTEELDVILTVLLKINTLKEKHVMLKKYLNVLRKIAHKKYKKEYISYYEKIHKILVSEEWASDKEKNDLNKLDTLAKKRFKNPGETRGVKKSNS